MKKNKINKLFGLFGAALATMVAASCTDVESLEIKTEHISDVDPALYAQYLENLNNYKKSDHKVMYAWFDNSEKNPYSRAHHMSDVPDSLDVVSVMYPAQLADFERTDMEELRKKGTKVVYTINFDQIQKDYTNQVKEGTLSDGAFASYLQSELDTQLGYVDAFDGMIVAYKGTNPIYMSTDQKNEAKSLQDTFFGAISNWKSGNPGKMLTFQGYPENLIGQTILSDCEHIILVTDNVKDAAQISVVAYQAMASSSVPKDRFVVAVSTVSLDPADKTGYFDNGNRALAEAAYWVTEPSDYTRAGIAIYNVQNDYYNMSFIYPYVKEAINIMNPAPKK